MYKPLVSVIIPVYNAAKYLPACIGSVMAQTWAAVEVIIVDDGSTDESLTIAKRYHSDNVKIISQSNGGASNARNRGLQEASGDYIQFLDADDLLSADKIEAQITDLQKHEDCIGLCDTVHFQSDENISAKLPIREWYAIAEVMEPVDFLMKLYGGDLVGKHYGGMIQPNAWLTPRCLIEKAGLWNEDLTLDDDGEFFCRVLLHSKGIKYSANGINFYRKFKAVKSLSSKKDLKSFASRKLSTDLKYNYLKNLLPETILNKIFARQYWEIGVDAYPDHKELSADAIKQAKALKYSGSQYKAGKLATLLSNLIGWKAVKLLSHFIHRNNKETT